MEETLSREEMWYWFCNIPGIGLKRRRALIDHYGDVKDVYENKQDKNIGIDGFGEKLVEQIMASKDEKRIRRELSRCKKRNIQFITREDERYPKRWLKLYDAPYGYYLLGRMPEEESYGIGIVGARDASIYGQDAAICFGKELSRAGFNVISGMARGIDGYAAWGAIKGSGYSMAVLGSGVDYCYPIENWELYQRLIKQGGVISEYAPGTLPMAGHFPPRNRLISGLSDGILVIEARKRSGTFITVDSALEQGKDVFVIPGRINDERSSGCHELIKMGAMLVTTPEDIMEFYHVNRKTTDENKTERLVQLNDLEKELMKLLDEDPKHLNDILEMSDRSVGELMQGLMNLELNNLIWQPSKNFYAVCLETNLQN